MAGADVALADADADSDLTGLAVVVVIALAGIELGGLEVAVAHATGIADADGGAAVRLAVAGIHGLRLRRDIRRGETLGRIVGAARIGGRVGIVRLRGNAEVERLRGSAIGLSVACGQDGRGGDHRNRQNEDLLHHATPCLPRRRPWRHASNRWLNACCLNV